MDVMRRNRDESDEEPQLQPSKEEVRLADFDIPEPSYMVDSSLFVSP